MGLDISSEKGAILQNEYPKENISFVAGKKFQQKMMPKMVAKFIGRSLTRLNE